MPGLPDYLGAVPATGLPRRSAGDIGAGSGSTSATSAATGRPGKPVLELRIRRRRRSRPRPATRWPTATRAGCSGRPSRHEPGQQGRPGPGRRRSRPARRRRPRRRRRLPSPSSIPEHLVSLPSSASPPPSPASRLMRGYGPLFGFAVLFLLMAALVPTVGPGDQDGGRGRARRRRGRRGRPPATAARRAPTPTRPAGRPSGAGGGATTGSRSGGRPGRRQHGADRRAGSGAAAGSGGGAGGAGRRAPVRAASGGRPAAPQDRRLRQPQGAGPQRPLLPALHRLLGRQRRRHLQGRDRHRDHHLRPPGRPPRLLRRSQRQRPGGHRSPSSRRRSSGPSTAWPSTSTPASSSTAASSRSSSSTARGTSTPNCRAAGRSRSRPTP